MIDLEMKKKKKDILENVTLHSMYTVRKIKKIDGVRLSV